MAKQRDTGISWTDETWNVVRGCKIVSEGCRNCYAMRQAHRMSGPGKTYEGLTRVTASGPVWTGSARLVPELLDKPVRWTRPRRIFVNAMSDLFHEDLSDEDIANVFAVMAAAREHTFQVLTKRPERMQNLLSRALRSNDGETDTFWEMIGWRSLRYRDTVDLDWPLPNVWLGVSVEDQKTADERLPLLFETPAALRWVSAESLLGPVDLFDVDGTIARKMGEAAMHYPSDVVHWVVVGGESGHGARPMHPQWARSIRDQCLKAGVPFHFKQWGAWAPNCLDGGHVDKTVLRPGEEERPIPGIMFRCGKKNAGRELDSRTWDEFPEVRV